RNYISSPDFSFWRLSYEVWAWLPIDVQENNHNVRRLPGRWYELNFDYVGSSAFGPAPDYDCCNCGFSEIVYKLKGNERCTNCGWTGSQEERIAYDSLVREQSG